MALIPEEGRTFADPDDFETQVREYVRLKATMKAMEARTKELHAKFMDKIELEGQEDSEGNIILDLPFDADGFTKLERQRRAARKLDETLAEAIIAETGLEEEVYEYVKTLSEEKLMAAYYEGKISEEQLDNMFPTKVTWALWTKK
jgi:hypothetical protein